MGSVLVGWRNLKTDLPPRPQKIFSELKNMRSSEFSYHPPEHLKRGLQTLPEAQNPSPVPLGFITSLKAGGDREPGSVSSDKLQTQ